MAVVVLLLGKRGGPDVPEVPGLTAPSEISEGENWTHKELAEYLAKKGVKVDYFGGVPSGDGLVSYFVEPGVGAIERLERKVPVILCKDRKAAIEVAGSHKASFLWGRFVINTDLGNPHADRLANQIKTALTAK